MQDLAGIEDLLFPGEVEEAAVRLLHRGEPGGSGLDQRRRRGDPEPLGRAAQARQDIAGGLGIGLLPAMEQVEGMREAAAVALRRAEPANGAAHMLLVRAGATAGAHRAQAVPGRRECLHHRCGRHRVQGAGVTVEGTAAE